MDIPGKYMDFCLDYSFKRILGQESTKDLLINFLNAVFQGRETIVDLTYLNTEQLGLQEWERRAVFDVYCRNEKGEHFIVEMQKAPQHFFKDRSVFYSTFAIQSQDAKGDHWNFELKCVYMVCVLDYVFDNGESWYHEVKLLDTATHEVFYDKLTYVYFELPKFNKTEDELTSPLEKWLFLMRHLYSMPSRPSALSEPAFDKVFEVAELARLDKKERMQYEENLKNARDWYSILETATQRGHDKGHAEGFAEAKKLNIQKTIQTLRELNHTDEAIAAVLVKNYDLSQDEAADMLKNTTL